MAKKETADLTTKTAAELAEMLDELSIYRQELKTKARAIQEVYRHKLAAENAGTHGLTVEEYEAVKAKAHGDTTPNAFGKALSEARRAKAVDPEKFARDVQSVRAVPAAVGAKAVDKK